MWNVCVSGLFVCLPMLSASSLSTTTDSAIKTHHNIVAFRSIVELVGETDWAILVHDDVGIKGINWPILLQDRIAMHKEKYRKSFNVFNILFSQFSRSIWSVQYLFSHNRLIYFSHLLYTNIINHLLFSLQLQLTHLIKIN